MSNEDHVNMSSQSMAAKRDYLRVQDDASAISSSVCDRMRAIKMAEDFDPANTLSSRIASLEESDPWVYKYIRKLEYVHEGIHCASCRVNKTVRPFTTDLVTPESFTGKLSMPASLSAEMRADHFNRSRDEAAAREPTGELHAEVHCDRHDELDGIEDPLEDKFYSMLEQYQVGNVEDSPPVRKSHAGVKQVREQVREPVMEPTPPASGGMDEEMRDELFIYRSMNHAISEGIKSILKNEAVIQFLKEIIKE